MKHNLLLTSLFSLVLASASVQADTLYWSGGGTAIGGAGTWNTTTARWGTDTSGPFTTIWNNAVTNDAFLYGTNTGGGSVVLGANITMNGTLTWQQTPGTYASYTINGANTLTFSPGSALSCDNTAGGSIGVGSFSAPYAGTITKTGAAQVEFNNSNGKVTKFIFKQGTASFASYNRLGSGGDVADFLTFDGGQFRMNTTTAWTMGRSITVNSGNGTLFAYNASTTCFQDKPITWNGGTLRLWYATFLLTNTASSGAGTLAIWSTTTAKCVETNVIPSGVTVSFVSGSSAVLNLNSKAQTISSLSASASYSGASVTLGSGTLTLSNGRSSFSGVISGTGGLVKQGTSTEVLFGNNTYSGATTVSAGTLTFAGASTCTGVTTVSSGATLRIATNSLAFPNSPIILNAGANLDVWNQDVTIAILSGSGTVISNANHTLTVNSNLTTGGVFQNYSCFSGTLTNGSLAKDGTHAMALRGSNTFDGTLTLANGTLSVGAAPDRLPPTLDLTVPSPALFQLDANNQTVKSLAGNGNVNLGGGTLTINPGTFSTFSGVIQNSELAGSSTALGHGLRGYYYSNIDLTALSTVRDDATVNVANMTYMPDYTPNVTKTNQISARWLGQVLTTASGDYKFTTICDDGSRLWVNGALLVDNWVAQGATNKSGTITLAANTRYDLVMEYYNGSSVGGAMLLWTPPGDLTTNIIPTDYLFLPGPGKLVKTGSGTQYLGGFSTYGGGTSVSGGSGSVLEAQVDGALGSGNVAVDNGSTLQLDSNGGLSATADLLLSGPAPLVTLNFGGVNNIHAISFDGGATYLPTGTYGTTAAGATHPDDTRFQGGGLLNVTAGPSTIALASSGSPAVYGSTVTLTATVTPSGVTGTVTFFDGANFLGTATPNGAGVATLSVNNLPVTASPHSLTAMYSGDANYSPATSSPAFVSTTVATLTPNIVVANKAYDGTTNATISSATTFTGILSGDTNYVHIDGSAVAGFVDKNVGVGKTVNITGMALSGSLASNYQMPTTTASVTANITAKALTVTNLAGVNRVYDGTPNATFTGTPGLSGVISPDVVTLGGAPVASFATRTIGTNKVVTVNGYTLGGADAANYSVTAPTVTANISQSPISVSGLSVVTKTYDGTNSATLSGTAALSPAPFLSDVVTLGGTPIASFNNKNAGSGKAVTVTGYTISGTDATNYNLSQPGLTGTINTVPTSCVLVSSVNPSTNGQNVTFTATITASPLPVVNDAPTSTASFTVNTIPVSSPTVVSNAPGVATVSWSSTSLALGTNAVLAAYLGDGNYQASNNSVQQVVKNPISATAVTITNIAGTTLKYDGGSGAKFILVQSPTANASMNTWTYPGLTNTATPGSFTIPPVGTGAPRFYRVLSQ